MMVGSKRKGIVSGCLFFAALFSSAAFGATTSNLVVNPTFTSTANWTSSLGFQACSGGVGGMPCVDGAANLLAFAFIPGTVLQNVTLPAGLTSLTLSVDVADGGAPGNDASAVTLALYDGVGGLITTTSWTGAAPASLTTQTLTITDAAALASAVTARVTLADAGGNGWAGNYGTRFSNVNLVGTTPDAPTDPTGQSGVRGLVSAQANAMNRFTGVQVQNVWNHLQSLHNGFNAKNGQFAISVRNPELDKLTGVLSHLLNRQGNDVHVPESMHMDRTEIGFVPANQKSGQIRLAANNRTPDSTMMDADPDASGSGGASYQPGVSGDLPFGLWAAGTIDYGSFDRSGEDNKFSSRGISIGVDYQARENLILGAALGYGFDRTRVDGLGSRARSHQVSGSVYGSYQPSRNWFLDALVGYGDANFDIDRFSSADGVLLTGDRDGKVIYGSVGVSNYLTIDHLRLHPYLRADYASARLDGYAENGASTFAITYNDATFHTTSASAGIQGNYDIKLQSGVLTPSARLQYSHNFSGDISQNMFFSGTGIAGGVSNFKVGSTPDNQASLGLGLSYYSENGVSVDLGYTASRGSNSYHSNAFAADVRFAF